MKYHIGQKVRILKKEEYPFTGSYCKVELGETGYISEIYKNDAYIIDKLPQGKGRYLGYFAENEVEPVNEFQVPFYVDCPTQEIWDKVEKKMFDMGYKWCNEDLVRGHHPYTGRNIIEVEGSPPTIGSEIGTPYNKKSKHIPYQQFLGEEVKREFKVGDRVQVRKDLIIGERYGRFYLASEYAYLRGVITTIIKKDTSGFILQADHNNGKNGVIEHIWDKEMLKLITPVEEKEESQSIRSSMRADIYPMYTLSNGGGLVAMPIPERVNPFYKLSNTLMSGFKKATAFIKRLGEPLSTYYSLGWVELDNDEFTTTSEGKQALADFTLIGGAKTFEEYAKKELSRRKKASKVKDEDED